MMVRACLLLVSLSLTASVEVSRSNSVGVSRSNSATEAKPSPPTPERPQPRAGACTLEAVGFDWDFSLGLHGFQTLPCDESGEPVWQHGPTTEAPGAPGDVWGTILDAHYVDEAGEALRSPAFYVDAQTYLLEVTHYFDIEWEYDGGTVVVEPYGDVIAPIGGYTVPALSTSSPTGRRTSRSCTTRGFRATTTTATGCARTTRTASLPG